MRPPRFSDAMALEPVDGLTGDVLRNFSANLNEYWTIGPKVHGGTMVALCANAAREGYADGSVPGAQPVAVSVNFLSAPDPGPVRVLTTVHKRGRRTRTDRCRIGSGGADVRRRRRHPTVGAVHFGLVEPLLRRPLPGHAVDDLEVVTVVLPESDVHELLGGVGPLGPPQHLALVEPQGGDKRKRAASPRAFGALSSPIEL